MSSRPSFDPEAYKASVLARATKMNEAVLQKQEDRVFDKEKVVCAKGYLRRWKIDKNAETKKEGFVADILPKDLDKTKYTDAAGTTKEYYKPVKAQVVLEELNEVTNVCKKVDENSYDFTCNVSWIPENLEALKAALPEANQPDAPPHLARIKELFDAEGKPIKTLVVRVYTGEEYDFKVDYSRVGPLHAVRPGTNIPLFSPNARLELNKLKAEIYPRLYVKKEEPAKGEEAQPAVETRMLVGVSHPIFSVQGGTPKVLTAFMDTRIPSTEVVNDKIPLMGHHLIDPSVDPNSIPSRLTLSITDFSTTPLSLWSPECKGFSVMRMPQPYGDFLKTGDTEEVPKVTLRCQVLQWIGQPGNEEKTFSLKIIQKKDSKELMWRQLGAPKERIYAGLMTNNPGLIFLVGVNVWKKPTIDKVASEEEKQTDLALFSGFYVGDFNRFLVDFPRTFKRGGVAYEVSEQWVKSDFDECYNEVKKRNSNTVTINWNFKPDNADVWTNPLDGGVEGHVVPLGFGGGKRAQLAKPNPTRPKENLLSLKAEDASAVLDGSKYQYFVLLASPIPNKDAKWTEKGVIADSYLDQLITEYDPEYVVYALKRDIIMGSSWDVIHAPQKVETNEEEKRPSPPPASDSPSKRAKVQEDDEGAKPMSDDEEEEGDDE